MTANDLLLDASVRRQISMLSMRESEARRVVRFLTDEVWGDTLGLLSSAQAKGLTSKTRRLQQVLGEMREIIGDGYARGWNRLTPRLVRVAQNEAQWLSGTMRQVTPLAVELAQVTPLAVRSAATAGLIEGATYTQLTKRLTESTKNMVTDAVRRGLARGDSSRAISRALARTAQLSNARAATLTRTAVTNAASQSRQTLYEANSDVLQGVRYVATLDIRTTDICGDLDGQVFPIDDGPRPPQHHNCRSTTTPVLKTFRQLGIPVRELSDASRESLSGSVSEKLTYKDWLKNQSTAVQNEALGVRRAQLYRAGKVEIGKFTGPTGKLIRLEDLEK